MQQGSQNREVHPSQINVSIQIPPINNHSSSKSKIDGSAIHLGTSRKGFQSFADIVRAPKTSVITIKTREDGVSDIQIRAIGGKTVVLKFSTVEQMKSTLEGGGLAWLYNWFNEDSQWSHEKTVIEPTRNVCVELLPLHLWNAGTFFSIGRVPGDVIALDEVLCSQYEPVSGDKLNQSSLMIRTLMRWYGMLSCRINKVDELAANTTDNSTNWFSVAGDSMSSSRSAKVAMGIERGKHALLDHDEDICILNLNIQKEDASQLNEFEPSWPVPIVVKGKGQDWSIVPFYRSFVGGSIDADGSSGGVLCIWDPNLFTIEAICCNRNFVFVADSVSTVGGYTLLNNSRHEVLFGLSASVNLNSLVEDLFTLLSAESVFPALASLEDKLRTTVLKAPHVDLLSCMEMAKVADLIAFVASTSFSCEENSSSYIDSFGSQYLSVLRVLGSPSTVVLIRDLPNDLKRRQDVKKTCTSILFPEFPEDYKFYPADTKDELHKFMWLFKEQRLTVPHWRHQRPYLMAQKVDLVADTSNSEKCTLLLIGFLRAWNLSVNQLVHVSGAGDFHLCKIELLKDPCPLNARKEGDLMISDETNDVQVVRSLAPDPMKQEPLLFENVPDPLESRYRELISKFGYAAWIVDDSKHDDDADDGMALDENDSRFPGLECNDKVDLDDDQASLQINFGESDEETDIDSVMMEGESMAKEQIEEEIRKVKEAHAEDEEFPDEVDTPLDVPARRCFAKYRGLKSFRTSSWDPKESLPPEYAKIFACDNFTRTQKHVLAKALDVEQGGVEDCIPTSSYARLHIKEVPTGVASKLCILANTIPIIACGLLQHESKISVLHFRPIFSSDNINSDKHKMERFLHAGRFSIASIYAPISFPPLPLIVLKSEVDSASPSVAAVGSLRSIGPDRINLKKIILTGYELGGESNSRTERQRRAELGFLSRSVELRASVVRSVLKDGLPASPFSYVDNISPGLPLFSFGYSDRRIYDEKCEEDLVQPRPTLQRHTLPWTSLEDLNVDTRAEGEHFKAVASSAQTLKSNSHQRSHHLQPPAQPWTATCAATSLLRSPCATRQPPTQPPVQPLRNQTATATNPASCAALLRSPTQSESHQPSLCPCSPALVPCSPVPCTALCSLVQPSPAPIREIQPRLVLCSPYQPSPVPVPVPCSPAVIVMADSLKEVVPAHMVPVPSPVPVSLSHSQPAQRVTSVLLNGKNFHAWSRSFQLYPSGKRKTRWILGKEPKPAEAPTALHDDPIPPRPLPILEPPSSPFASQDLSPCAQAPLPASSPESGMSPPLVSDILPPRFL
ncbi:hypothetical protein Acr_00g0016250 [Actinidia rufa]|uniref:Uncharacterized protein n=1 Tax=Actinidia rufa TaxID=165716 RepID=A0A7J0DCL4_9ERIC|nr:hypothetical protein Acr_00g0016250 [Actinidia rufa]